MARTGRRWGAALLLLAALVGCATLDEGGGRETLIWPPPPDQPRYVWEAVFQTAKDVEIPKEDKEKSALEKALENNSEAKKIFKKPVRVASINGRTFVTDSMSKAVHVFDAQRRRYYRFGTRREGTLEQPLGIAVDHQGQVYVVDAGRKRVVVYDPLGLWIRFIGDKSGLERPGGIAVTPHGDRIYVTENGRIDTEQHALWIFDKEGRVVRKIGHRGTGDGEFNYPTDVALGPDGRVFVLDAGNFRVQIFDREGKFLAKWGKVGRGLGQFARPRALTVDRDSHVYVVDGSFVNVQVFNDAGQLLMPMGERGQVDGPGQFSSPFGIAADETGRIYIVDQWLGKVEVLRKLSEEEGQAMQAGKRPDKAAPPPEQKP
ncbi:MAG: 6-bladed beta-propeller [Magnetococcales bacterium]|nr:6-bladed beta-propeller [Magnetococcales bacterium]